MGERPRRVRAPLLVLLFLGAVSCAWEVGEAGGEPTMGQMAPAGSECGGGSMAGCFSDEEEEFALDSETNRMLQQNGGQFLSNLLLKRGAAPCQIRGRSYTRCGSPPRSSFNYARCSGTCLRSSNYI